MEYTSTLKKITKVESWINKKDNKNWTKYRFDFANGHNPFVFRTDELHYKENTELIYDLDQANNKAKIITKNPMPNNTNTYTKPKDDVQKYIIRQSSLNRATDLWGNIDLNNYDQDVKLITELARKFENYVYNG